MVAGGHRDAVEVGESPRDTKDVNPTELELKPHARSRTISSMSLVIDCPTCRCKARVVTDGYVNMHFDSEGDLCPFRRTAHAGGGGGIKRTPQPNTAAAVQAQETPQRRTKKSQPPATPNSRCLRCGNLAPTGPAYAGRLAAHTRPSGHWCRGGVPPTEQQRKKNRPKRSVWTVSGGLPTLGRRK